MKHCLSLLNVILFSALLTISCGSEEEIPAGVIPSSEYFKIVGDTIILDGQAVEGKFSVTADCAWSIVTNAWDGLHATPDHGEGTQEVTITTTANDTPTTRKGMLTISTSDGITKDITLQQQPGNIQLEVTPGELRFARGGGSADVTVTSNTEWEVSGGTDWCTASKTSGTGTGSVTINATENNEKEERTATFSFTPVGSTNAVTVVVTQGVKDIILSASLESMSFDATTVQTKELEIFCNDTWVARTSTDWVKLDTETATGNGTINVSCEANNTGAERTATITLECSGVQAQVTVTQRSFNVVFNLYPSTLPDFSAAGGSQPLTVVSNTPWTLNGFPDWCHPSALEGDGEVTLDIRVDPNEQTESRTATLLFRPTDADPVPLTITQKGKETIDIILEVSPTNLNFGAAEESKTVTVTSNTTWIPTVDKDWVTIETASQTTAGELTTTELKVSCAANTTGAGREATLTVKAGSKQREVSITQSTADTPVVYDLAVTDTIDGKATLTASYRSTLAVTEYGFVYATHASPTLDDTKVPFYGSSTTGTMTTTLTGLTLGTTYYVRAYAVNASGTAYSDERHFSGQGRQPGQGDNGTPTLSRRK